MESLFTKAHPLLARIESRIFREAKSQSVGNMWGYAGLIILASLVGGALGWWLWSISYYEIMVFIGIGWLITAGTFGLELIKEIETYFKLKTYDDCRWTSVQHDLTEEEATELLSYSLLPEELEILKKHIDSSGKLSYYGVQKLQRFMSPEQILLEKERQGNRQEYQEQKRLAILEQEKSLLVQQEERLNKLLQKKNKPMQQQKEIEYRG